MKRSFLIKSLIVAACSALWLYPYDYRSDQIVLIPCFLASVFLIFFIRNKYLFFLPALITGIILSIYSSVYLICFFPAVCWVVLLKSAGQINTDRAVGYDGFFWSFLLTDVIVCSVSLAQAFRQMTWNIVFSPKVAFLFFMALVFVIGAVAPFRKPADANNTREKTAHAAKKIRIVYLFCLPCVFAAIVYCWRVGDYIALYTVPAFTCFCVAFIYRSQLPVF